MPYITGTGSGIHTHHTTSLSIKPLPNKHLGGRGPAQTRDFKMPKNIENLEPSCHCTCRFGQTLSKIVDIVKSWLSCSCFKSDSQ